jgi:hypothetical protein
MSDLWALDLSWKSSGMNQFSGSISNTLNNPGELESMHKEYLNYFPDNPNPNPDVNPNYPDFNPNSSVGPQQMEQGTEEPNNMNGGNKMTRARGNTFVVTSSSSSSSLLPFKKTEQADEYNNTHSSLFSNSKKVNSKIVINYYYYYYYYYCYYYC